MRNLATPLVPLAFAFAAFAGTATRTLAQGPPAAAATGRDWFVRAGAVGGDGTQQAPFDDPWRALARCEAGDRIHVAGGRYFGKLRRGTWTIPVADVQLLGGYDDTFTSRDPWQRPTQLCADPAGKIWALDARLVGTEAGAVVDGFVIDMQDTNAYVDEQRSARRTASGESAMRFTQPSTVRNCVVVNPGQIAIDARIGAVIENNLVVNPIVWGIVVTGANHGLDRTAATVRGNTVLFARDPDKPGAGGYGGAAIALRGAAVVADNVLAHCDNAAIYAAAAPDRLAVTGNTFWKNRFANFATAPGASRAVVDDAELERIEELGLTACDGNTVADPGLAYDAGKLAAGFAPALPLAASLAMFRPLDATAKAGARVVALPAPRFAAAAPAAPTTFTDVALTSWSRDPRAVDGKAVAMVVAIGPVANVSTVPAQYPRDRIAGVTLYDPDGAGERVIGFYWRGSTADRVCAEATGWYQGSGKPAKLHLVRGIACTGTGVVKGCLLVTAVERHEPPVAAAARPAGRDWFVRAGATGGDGSREKPFRDPFQALERCEGGDSIHVATGAYHGKLKAGRWTIAMPHVHLLGGYDAEFAQRDPWRNPTRLARAADHKGAAVGYTIEGAGDHDGVVVDGFVFDKRGDNVYQENGALELKGSDKTEHLWLSRPGCAVRNCVFVNGAHGALRVTNGQEVANCVFVNHVLQAVWVERGHTQAPFTFRDNTALFVWSTRPGNGHGASGSLLRLCTGTRADVRGNVFAYADNDAIRIETDPSDVALRGNAFANNLWSHVQNMPTAEVVDDALFAQLADLGVREAVDNRATLPALAIDAAWLAAHQKVRVVTEDAAAKAPPPPPPPPSNPFRDDAPSTPVADTSSSSSSSRSSGNPFAEPDRNAAATPPGETFAPAYDWQQAVALVAASGDVGARRRELAVTFLGAKPAEPEHTYAATTWEVALRADAWTRLGGQRVQLDGAIRATDKSHDLADLPREEYACYQFSAPDGEGLPLRCYVKRGTKAQRVFDQAKGFGTGKPSELHRLRGVARERRQFVVEAVEKLP